MVNFVPAFAYHFCPALPAAFMQPGARLLAKLCIKNFFNFLDRNFGMKFVTNGRIFGRTCGRMGRTFGRSFVMFSGRPGCPVLPQPSCGLCGTCSICTTA